MSEVAETIYTCRNCHYWFNAEDFFEETIHDEEENDYYCKRCGCYDLEEGEFLQKRGNDK